VYGLLSEVLTGTRFAACQGVGGGLWADIGAFDELLLQPVQAVRRVRYEFWY
jgi:hypothetical protein